MKRLIFLLCLVLSGFANGVGQKRALIFGIAGQDGSYLTEFLLAKGYEVHGVKRYHSSGAPCFVDHLYEELRTKGCKDLILHWGDLTDSNSVNTLVRDIRPDEIYNLGAQTQVQVSFELPEYTSECDAMGPLRILEAIRRYGLTKITRFYQASTSKFLAQTSVGQRELMDFAPNSPYATAKLFAFWTTRNYRDAYGIFACNGVCFNHESERRPCDFLSRKITYAVARIAHGLQDVLLLGNLDSRQDWGYAPDYVEVMWLMLQQEKPGDYVVATGEMHSVREFVALAFHEIGKDIDWKGEGVNEIGFDRLTGRTLVKVSPQFFRPLDAQIQYGDASRITRLLKWKPRTSFNQMVKLMVAHDLQAVK